MRIFKYLTLAVGSILIDGCLFARPFEINSAVVASLSTNIQGIGTKLAQAIVDYRKENGPFLSLGDLMSVKGIGPVILERNLDQLLILNPADEKGGVEFTN